MENVMIRPTVKITEKFKCHGKTGSSAGNGKELRANVRGISQRIRLADPSSIDPKAVIYRYEEENP